MVNTAGKRVQRVRGPTDSVDKYIGPPGEFVMDMSRNELRIHDGKTPGGHRIVNYETLRRLFLLAESEFGDTEFAEDLVGILTRVSNKGYALREIEGADGVTVGNPAGSGGNPTIGLPNRLKATLPIIADANLAILTGWYLVGKGSGANLPAAWLTTNDVIVEVGAYLSGSDTIVSQTARSADLVSTVEYTRNRVANVWSAWSTEPPVVVPVVLSGDSTKIHNGVDEVKRLWSASEIQDMVADLLATVQYIDLAEAPRALSFNQLFLASGAGAGTSQIAFGPYTLVTNDRFELVASATAAISGVASAVIEIEIDGGWTIIESLVVNGTSTEAVTGSVRKRFIKTASGIQLSDDDWFAGTAIAGTMTGRFRVTVGADDQAGARGYRWRP